MCPFTITSAWAAYRSFQSGSVEVVPRAVGVPQPIIMIADGGIGAIQLPAPGGRVTVRVVGGRAAGVRVVPDGDDGPGQGVEQARRLNAAGVVAIGDVTRE